MVGRAKKKKGKKEEAELKRKVRREEWNNTKRKKGMKQRRDWFALAKYKRIMSARMAF